MSNYKFIVNPESSRGKGKRMGDWLFEECKRRNLDFNLQVTKYPRDATEIAANSVEKYEFIVAVGGDGTLQEVINGLVGVNTKVGIIPVGTGNDFIRAAGIPHLPDKALDNLIAGNTKHIDIGKVGDLYFHNGLGVGFDAKVVEKSLRIKFVRGKLVYLLAIFQALFSYKSPEIELIYNNQSFKQKLFFITVGNGTCLGGGIKLTPFAKLDDGFLDLNIIKDVNKFKVISNLLKAYSGNHVNNPMVIYDKCKQIEFKSEMGFAVHADGELISSNLNELQVKIIPEAIKFVVPK